MKAVFNTSPIIFLGKLDLIDEVLSLFETVYVPTGVMEELAAKKWRGRDIAGAFSNRSNVTVIPVKEDRFYSKLREVLGKGETEAILLGFDYNSTDDYVILDDKAARQKALSFGLRVKGTLGILRILYQKELLSLYPEQLYEKLMECEFRVGKTIFEEIMKEFY